MDYKVAANIYSKPWLIESHAALENLDLLEQIKAGKAQFGKPQATALQIAYASSDLVSVAPVDRYSARDHAGYEGKSIAILAVTGPLMKEDYCSWFGTASLRNEFLKIEATESIKTIVVLFDSPGGQVDGTEAFGSVISASAKETIALIQGMACSAAYWLASSCKKVVATAKTDIIGSIGTMISFYDRSQYMEENGIILREFYADASKDKNKMFNEAKAGKGKLIVEQLLNPLNDIFLSHVKDARGEKLNQAETLSGKTFLAEKALEFGLVDEISSLDTVINNHFKKHKTTSITMKWQKIMAFLGFSAAVASADLKDEHLDKIEASLADAEKTKADLDAANARVTTLETEATANEEKIKGLEAQVTALTTENTNLKAEVAKLGKEDGGNFTDPESKGDTFNDGKVDAAEMDFQKELLDKV